MAESYFVHYTVNPPYSPKPEAVHCVAGPYNGVEVVPQKQDIQGYAGISDVYVNESRERYAAK